MAVAIAVAVGGFRVMLHSERAAARAGELLERRWPAITAAALISHLSLYLVLLVTCATWGSTTPR